MSPASARADPNGDAGVRTPETRSRYGRPVADAGSWTFLTNHGHVLLLLAREPELRLRDLAERVGITERSAQKIVAELEAAGYVAKTRIGRRNVYRVDPSLRFRHPLEAGHQVGELLDLFAPRPPAGTG